MLFKNAVLIPLLHEQVKRSNDDKLKALSRQCLTLCGYTKPPRGRGINVLAIDGGGTRGMMGLEILNQLEKCSGGKKVLAFVYVLWRLEIPLSFVYTLESLCE